jgi:outer membrane protein assembly factor BamB
VYALNASTGGKLWKHATGYLVYSSPAVANGVVYVGSDDHKVYALNAKTGAKLWSYTAGTDVLPSPAVANGVVYVVSWDDGKIYAFGLKQGQE